MICSILEIMLTRREVLKELNRMGVRKLSLLKTYLRDFEGYIGPYYDFQVLRTKKTNQEVWIAPACRPGRDCGMLIGVSKDKEMRGLRELKIAWNAERKN